MHASSERFLMQKCTLLDDFHEINSVFGDFRLVFIEITQQLAAAVRCNRSITRRWHSLSAEQNNPLVISVIKHIFRCNIISFCFCPISLAQFRVKCVDLLGRHMSYVFFCEFGEDLQCAPCIDKSMVFISHVIWRLRACTRRREEAWRKSIAEASHMKALNAFSALSSFRTELVL